MRKWVVIGTTLINLVVCVLLLAILGSSARDKLNTVNQENLVRTCRLSAYTADSAAFQQDEDLETYFRSTAHETETVFTLYDDQGAILYSSRNSAKDELATEELSEIKESDVYEFRREHTQAKLGTWLYAGTTIRNGKYVLLVSCAEATLWDSFATIKVWVILLLLLATLVCGGMFGYMNLRTQMLIDNVRKVLIDISEGKLDSRLSGSMGDSMEETARFNEAIGRVQERVVKENTKTTAFSAITNYSKSGILAVDEQLNVLVVNGPARQMLGLVGVCEGEPIAGCSKDVKLDSVFTEAMAQQGVYTKEVAARTAQGRSHRPIRMYISPMMDGDTLVGAVAMVEDITELRRLEGMRVDFVANVSHELKTPLTSISGFLETLENGAINDPVMAKKCMGIMRVEVDRLYRLITDILSISKLESGTDPEPNEKIALDHVLNYVCEMLKPHGATKNVTVTFTNKTEEGDCYVLGNPDRVKQLFINLVENGIKYNKPEGGSVTVSLFNTEGFVNVSIADTGLGIAEENLPHLFERFYRVDKGRSRAQGGTGLGLAIVKHIVKSMNGMIEAHSRLGEGTEFLITIPRTDPPQMEYCEDEIIDK